MKTLKEKAQAYDKAIERAKIKLNCCDSDSTVTKNTVYDLFPELRESEDEKIRKKLIDLVKKSHEQGGYALHKWEADRMIAWLEKQDEQSLADKSELKLKFNIGDWVVTSYGKVNQVIAVDEDSDGFTLDDGTYFSGSWKDSYHLWSIEDAKQGDILYCESLGVKFIMILKCINQDGSLDSYCRYNTIDGFGVNIPKVMSINDPKPATKEQCEFLFQKMKEYGYTWNSEKKELLEIEEELTDFEKSLKHIMIETLECGDTRNLKADAEMLLRITQEPKEWSHEDDVMVHDILGWLPVKSRPEFNQRRVDWIKSLKGRVQPSQKWNEEDERMKNHTLQIIKKYWNSLPDTDYDENEISESCYNWIKSIKQRC